MLVSIDGLYPEIYRRARELGLHLPNLERLVREGTSADGMVGVFPTSTYPSHASLITGARPARHGITANTAFTPGSAGATWYWYADSLRARTLPQAAAAAGLTVGVSCWPALVGATWVKWHLPEIWSLGPDDTSSREKVLHAATPGLVAEVEKRYGAWSDDRFEWGKQDDRITDGAVYLLEAKRPRLLLVHLVEVDHALHGAGRNAPEALRAFERADGQLGRMLQAIERAGLAESTDVVVVGDHGFANIHTDFRPNVVLAARGLLASAGLGDGTWRALARTNTAAAGVYLKDPGDAAAGRTARAALDSLAAGPYAGVFEILDEAALDRYGAFPGAIFGLVCRPGYNLSGSAQGDVLSRSNSRGTHGFRPEDPLMHSGFVACGPSFQVGLRVPLVRMLDVAPTLAAILNADLGPSCEGIAVPGWLRGAVPPARNPSGGRRTAP